MAPETRPMAARGSWMGPTEPSVLETGNRMSGEFGDLVEATQMGRAELTEPGLFHCDANAWGFVGLVWPVVGWMFLTPELHECVPTLCEACQRTWAGGRARASREAWPGWSREEAWGRARAFCPILTLSVRTGSSYLLPIMKGNFPASPLFPWKVGKTLFIKRP